MGVTKGLRIRCRFIGKDGSMGYRHGQVYNIEVVGNTVVGLNNVPYESVQAFLANWLPLKPGD